MTDLEYLYNMRVRQARINEGDVRWYVVNAAGHVVKGPFDDKWQADLAYSVMIVTAEAEVEEFAAEQRDYPNG